MDSDERKARMRDLVRRTVEADPSLERDPWEMADRVLALWAEEHPDEDQVNEDDVFAAANEVDLKPGLD